MINNRIATSSPEAESIAKLFSDSVRSHIWSWPTGDIQALPGVVISKFFTWRLILSAQKPRTAPGYRT